MAGFTSYDDLINEMTVNGKVYDRIFSKRSTAPEAAGVLHSLWDAIGQPGDGGNPATTPGTAFDDESGSITFPDQGSDQKHLVSIGAVASQTCTLIVADRLVGVSGISVASTGNKTINSVALPRYSGTDAALVECYLEVTTATTTTAPVVNLNSYTNEAGTTGRSGGNVTFPAAATNVDTLIGPMPLQAGDKGIRSIEVGLNVGTAAAAGVVNVLLVRRLCAIPLIANLWNERDLVLQLASIPRIFDGASLMLFFQSTGTTANVIIGGLKVAYG